MIIGYARVSTKGQKHDGNSLEAQEKTLLENKADVVCKEAFTGTKTDRPVLNEVVRKLNKGDTLMVTKLDRLARSTGKGAELVKSLLDKGVTVHILNMGIMNDTPTGRLVVNIFFAFAEFERDMIVERTQEGKEIAREKEGYKEGRPKVVYPKEKRKRIKEELDKGTSIRQISKVYDIPWSSCKRLIEDIKENGI